MMLDYSKDFWRSKVFAYAATAAILFLILTVAAMFFYPGGTRTDPAVQGYSFLRNSFSNLGAIHAWSGASNLISASLFLPAMVMAGLALILFSAAFLQFFPKHGLGRISAISASITGIITGVCFIGVGFTPIDIQFLAHGQFSAWGFRFFAASALLWTIALFRHEKYPKRYAWVFVIFSLLLVVYIFLPNITFLILDFSPENRAVRMAIVNTGQKIIVYAAIVSVLIQSYGARSVNRNR